VHLKLKDVMPIPRTIVLVNKQGLGIIARRKRDPVEVKPMIRNRLLVLVAFIVFAAPAATEDQGGWQPPPPMPDDFDWVQLVSGEWLKGEIIVLYEETLEFESEELDELSLALSDINEIRSAGVVQVGFVGGETAVGQLLLQGTSVRVIGDEDKTFEKSRILSITSGPPREINFWNAKITVGANYRSGNTEQTETTNKARIQRRTVRNRLVFDFFGSYNLTSGEIVTDNQRLSGVWDRFISRRFFITPLFGEWYTDELQNISSQYRLGVGVGYTIVDGPRADWEVSGGPSYQHTVFGDVPEGDPESDDSPAFVVATVYELELNKWIDFVYQYNVTITNETSGSYNHHMLATVETEITKRLDFDVTFVWDRIQDPRAGSDLTVPKQDDYRLSFGLGFDF
jgi:hypothetical protein